mmetsp:Transcript_20495/g.26525  ORF Transcript_20495/g.26525 Transcript_20495/m.26525 type:complete len:100 (+) Transcript_20495:214-513(+)
MKYSITSYNHLSSDEDHPVVEAILSFGVCVSVCLSKLCSESTAEQCGLVSISPGQNKHLSVNDFPIEKRYFLKGQDPVRNQCRYLTSETLLLKTLILFK